MPKYIHCRIWSLEALAQHSIKRHLGKMGCDFECLLNNVSIKPCKTRMNSFIIMWIILDLSSTVMLLSCSDGRISVSVSTMNIIMVQVSSKDIMVGNVDI
jgi:hypothetical protein